MAYKPLPKDSKELLKELQVRFPDTLDTTELQGPFERGKTAGIIELLRELQQRINILQKPIGGN